MELVLHKVTITFLDSQNAINLDINNASYSKTKHASVKHRFV